MTTTTPKTTLTTPLTIPPRTTSKAAADRSAEILQALAPLLANQRRRWAARCHAHGLSIIGFHVLALLEMHGPTPMGRLADELGVALPNATGIIARMAERGIVERTHDDEDRRVVRVGLTDAGRALIGEMEGARIERMARLIGVMDDAQQRRLLRAAADLRAAAELIGESEEAPA